MNRAFLLAAAWIGLLCSTSGQLHAATLDIRIDLSNLVGTTAGNWNNISALTGATPNLIDWNTGLGTGVTIDGTGSLWTNFFGDDFAAFPNQSWLIQPATQDGAGLFDGQAGVFQLLGLGNSTYQIEVVSARTTFDYQNTIQVQGSLADRTFLGTPVNTPWGSTSDGLTPGNWLIWDNVNPINGQISIDVAAATQTLGIINALRITDTAAIPEPTSLALLGITAAGFCGVRLRRRRKGDAAETSQIV